MSIDDAPPPLPVFSIGDLGERTALRLSQDNATGAVRVSDPRASFPEGNADRAAADPHPDFNARVVRSEDAFTIYIPSVIKLDGRALR